MTHRSSFFIKACVFGILCFIFSGSYAQEAKPSSGEIKTKDSVLVWLKDLYEPGVKIEHDSMVISKESERLLHDKEYRKVMYPAVYSWDMAKVFIQQQEIKKAMWFFINLYLVNDKNKEMVVKSILVYDKLFKMEKLLVSSFYTYSLTDPEIGTIEEGNSKITAPHIMEKKLNALKAMLFYLDKYKPKDRKEDSTSR